MGKLAAIIFAIILLVCIGNEIKGEEIIKYNEYNYENGNGTILEDKIIGNVRWVFRKHEYKTIVVALRPVYDSPKENANVLFTVGCSDEEIDLVEIALEEDLESTMKTCWIKIRDTQNRIGWILGQKSKNEWTDPYFDGNGAVLEIILVGNKKWTARKVHPSDLFPKNGVNIYDIPSLTDSKILHQIIFPEKGVMSEEDFVHKFMLEVFELTKEKDRIEDEILHENDKTAFWAKVRNEQGIEGWVFGGYLDLYGTGGARYYPPETIVGFMVNEI